MNILTHKWPAPIVCGFIKVQAKHDSFWLIFFTRTFGELTDSAAPLLKILKLRVNNIYRLHALWCTHLWHENLSPKCFLWLLPTCTSSLHPCNTRYTANQNLHKPRVKANTRKQTISYATSVFWHIIPSILKNLNTYQFSKQIKLISLLWSKQKYKKLWVFNPFKLSTAHIVQSVSQCLSFTYRTLSIHSSYFVLHVKCGGITRKLQGLFVPPPWLHFCTQLFLHNIMMQYQ